VVFEGLDAAGKGGVIKRCTERVRPCVFRVVALPAPSDREKTQLYVQRYIAQMPAAGEIVLFDRSWYATSIGRGESMGMHETLQSLIQETNSKVKAAPEGRQAPKQWQDKWHDTYSFEFHLGERYPMPATRKDRSVLGPRGCYHVIGFRQAP
jgi:hypothetical protein